MPAHRKSFTAFLAEAVIVIGVLAIVGHVAANVWDRICIQSDMRQMKASLHALKNAVTNIGQAYDTLYTEIQGIEMDTQTKRSLPSNLQTQTERAQIAQADGCTSYDKPKKAFKNLLHNSKPFAKNTSWTDFSTGIGKDFFGDSRLESIYDCMNQCFDLKEVEKDTAKVEEKKVG